MRDSHDRKFLVPDSSHIRVHHPILQFHHGFKRQNDAQKRLSGLLTLFRSFC
jgi:hypothetical protein